MNRHLHAGLLCCWDGTHDAASQLLAGFQRAPSLPCRPCLLSASLCPAAPSCPLPWRPHHARARAHHLQGVGGAEMYGHQTPEEGAEEGKEGGRQRAAPCKWQALGCSAERHAAAQPWTTNTVQASKGRGSLSHSPVAIRWSNRPRLKDCRMWERELSGSSALSSAARTPKLSKNSLTR